MIRIFNIKTVLLVLWCCACPTLGLAVTPPIPPQPSQHVVDLAGVIDASDRDRLEVILKDLEDNYKIPVMVLTCNSLDGEPIENLCLKTALTWGGEKKLKVNGVLVAVAVNDQKYRIEVGEALKTTLPDSLMGRLGKRNLGSNLKKGDLSSGIFSTTTAIADHLAAARKSPASSNPRKAGWKSVNLTKRLTGMDPEDISQVAAASGIPTWAIIAVLLVLPVIAYIAWYNRGCKLPPGHEYSTLDRLLWWRRNR